MKKTFILFLLVFSFFNTMAGWLPTVTCKLPSDSTGNDLDTVIRNLNVVEVFAQNGGVNDVDLQVLNYISFDFKQNDTIYNGYDQEIKLLLSVKCYDINGSLISDSIPVLDTFKLVIPVYGSPQLPIHNCRVTFKNAYRIQLEVKGFWRNDSVIAEGFLDRRFSINAGISVERIYNTINNSELEISSTSINLQLSPIDIAQNNGSGTCVVDGKTDEYLLTWNTVNSAEEYHLEWTFVNDYHRGDISNSQFFTIPVSFSFPSNATRVVTKGTSFSIPNIFDRGYLLIRLRAVGVDPSSVDRMIYGSWYPDCEIGEITGNSQLSVSPCTTPVIGIYIEENQRHFPKLNWQLQTTFAEDGKKKDVISYMDGVYRNRQTVTRLSDRLRPIVGETIYDHLGRAGVNILPAPIPACSTSGQPSTLEVNGALRYYPGFNLRAETTIPYSFLDFDRDAVNLTCETSLNPMAVSNGASNYYSGNNLLKNLGNNKFIPSANGYPFSVTEYTPDNTNNIRRQGGVGLDLQLGNSGTDRSTQYFYCVPEAYQLQRLFGSEVGDPGRYKLNGVKDPNGQLSLSYLNPAGKVIATSLAGDPPSTVSMTPLIGSSTSPNIIEVDLLNKDANGNSIVNVKNYENGTIELVKKYFAQVEGYYNFAYNLSIDDLTELCPDDVCFKCVYELKIDVVNDCGQSVSYNNNQSSFPDVKTIGRFTLQNNSLSVDFNCINPLNYVSPVQNYNQVYLVPGEYIISKTLTLNNDVAELSLNRYLDTTDCIQSLHDFQMAELALIDTNDCYTTCEECVESLGTLDDFLAAGEGSELQYEIAYKNCMEPCTDPDVCEISYELMLGDISPYGQYGEMELVDQNGIEILEANKPLSIFNLNNQLPNIYSNTSPQWRYPIWEINGKEFEGYFDENGERVKVLVINDGSAISGFFPEVSVPGEVFDIDGNSYTYPENLLNLSDFESEWEPSFANSLVRYHPEYAYYIACRDHSVIQTNDEISSRKFDEELLKIETFADAVTKGYIKLVAGKYQINDWSVNNPQKSPENIYDPFFSNTFFKTLPSGLSTNIVLPDFKTKLNDRLTNYIPGYNFLEAIALKNRCTSNSGLIATTGCTDFGLQFYSDPQKDIELHDKEWVDLVMLYLAEKQKYQFQRMELLSALNRGISNNDQEIGWNECIDNTNFNPMRAFRRFNQNSPSTGQSFLTYVLSSGMFSPWQPCNLANYKLYSNKVKRFYRPGIIPGLNPDHIAALTYNSTGQCPLPISLQHLLNELVDNNQFLSTTPVNLKLLNSYDILLYKEFSGGVLPQTYLDYTWTYQGQSSNNHLFEIRDLTGNVVYSIRLHFNKPSFTITDVVDIFNLKGTTSTPTNGQFAFTCELSLLNSNNTAVYSTAGTSTTNLKDCKHPDVCNPNDLALEFETLINFMTSLNLANVNSDLKDALVPTYNNAQIPFFESYLYPFIPHLLSKLNISGGGKLHWEAINGNVSNLPLVFEISNSSNPTLKYRITINNIDPLGSVSFSSLTPGPEIGSIQGILPRGFSQFAMFAYNDSEEPSFKFEGSIIFSENGRINEVDLGDCSAPESVDCLNKDSRRRKDLEKMLSYYYSNGVVPKISEDLALNSGQYFTSLLSTYLDNPNQAFIPTYSSSTASSTNIYDKVVFGGQEGCQIEISFVQLSTTTRGVNYITDVYNLRPTGTTDQNGNLFEFSCKIKVKESNNSLVEYDAIGRSCFPIKDCSDCPDENTFPVEDIDELELANLRQRLLDSGLYLINQDLIAFNKYTLFLDSLNEVNAAAGGNGYIITPVGYDEFINNSYKLALDGYLFYLSQAASFENFDGYLNFNEYIIHYGTLQTCSSAYEYWINIVQSYNDYALSNNLPPHVIVPDTVFYMWGLCDSLNLYLEYLDITRAQGIAALPINLFFNIQSPLLSIDCDNLYQAYFNAYYSWYTYQQATIGENCPEYKLIPLYSPDNFDRDFNLCCSPLGQSLLLSYIASFDTLGCPDPVPSLSSCVQGAEPVQGEECNTFYVYLMALIDNYNHSPYAIAHNHSINTDLIRTFSQFVDKGYCNCVIGYINYLAPYLNAPQNTPLPYSIESFPDCQSTYEVRDTCYDKYYEYTEANINFNTWVLENGYDGDDSLVIGRDASHDYFIKKNLCACVDKYIAGLQAIQEGIITDPLKIEWLQLIENACDSNPCLGEISAVNILPPIPWSPNPCVEDMINNAYLSAQIKYDEYISNVKAEFLERYKTHCLGVNENFTGNVLDKEYHFTLYYYDQAGNLIKTVPPEGVELLDLSNSSIKQGLLNDLTFGSHTVFTNHRLPTKYEYNSLNQLTRQSLPDHERMEIVEHTLPTGISNDFIVESVEFNSSIRGFASANNVSTALGKLYSTADGGEHWTTVENYLAEPMNDFYFTSASATSMQGIAGGNHGTWLTSDNDGNHWKAHNLFNQQYKGHLLATYLSNSNGNFVGLLGGTPSGSNNLFRLTTNSNIHALSAVPASGINQNDTVISIFDMSGKLYLNASGLYNWATPTSGFDFICNKMYESTDGGINWNLKNNNIKSSSNFNSISFFKPDTAYVASNDGALLLGVFEGGTAQNWKWLVQNNSIDNKYVAINFYNKKCGVSLIDSIPGLAQIWGTVDSGYTWQLLSKPGNYYTKWKTIRLNEELLAIGENRECTRIFYNAGNSKFAVGEIGLPSNVKKIKAIDAKVSGTSFKAVLAAEDANNITIIYTTDNLNGISTKWKSKLSNTPLTQVKDLYLSISSNISIPVFSIVALTSSNSNNLYVSSPKATSDFYTNLALSWVNISCSTSVGGPSNYIDLNDAILSGFNNLQVDGFTTTGVIGRINVQIPAQGSSIVTTINPLTLTAPGVSVIETGVSNKALACGSNGTLIFSGTLSTTTPAQWTDHSTNLVIPPLERVVNVGVERILGGRKGTLITTDNTTSTLALKYKPTIVSSDVKGMGTTTMGTVYVGSKDGSIYELTISPTVEITGSIRRNLMPKPIESFVVNVSGIYCALNDNRIAFINIGAGQALPSFSNPISGNGSIARITNSFGNSIYASTSNGKLVSLNGTNTMALNNVDFPEIKGFDFYDEKNGIFITADKFIRRTSDGGSVWQTVLPDMSSSASWKGVTLINNQEALIYGDNGYLGLQTALGSPVTVTTSLTTSINEVKMKNNLEGLVVCGSGLRKLNRSNTGSTFQLSTLNSVNLGPGINLTDLHLFNNGSSVVLGGTNAYYITAPIGNNATGYQLNLGAVSGTLNDVYFHDDRTGYIVGDDGLALRCNYAQNLEVLSQSDIQSPVWVPINLKDPYSVYTTSSAPGIDLKSVAFSDRHNGIFAGANGNGSPASKYIMKVKDEINYFSTRFWYDGLGRLIVSQNSKQFDQGTYSYTRYDHLGRILESGEKTENSATAMKFYEIAGSEIFGYFNMRTMDYEKFETWISGNGARKEVTYTIYDEPTSTPPGNQDNLRNRVASILYFDIWNPNLIDYQFASHFSYDIHGNVKELWQENRHVKGILTNQDFKHIKYKYDLISGKVNKVMYQPGKSDAFYHKYLYDGDNRIVEVFTSRDDIVWESDARYFYYDHGPLARVELGDNNVQGVDYAYTLQGWIKGINSTTLDPSRDMGSDGNRSPSNIHQDFARDICSYSLNYFKDDYLPIGQETTNDGGNITLLSNLTPATSFLADLNGSSTSSTPSDLELEGGSLYNGNIRSMVTTLPVTASIQPTTGLSYSHQVQGFGYRYDVLNRISSAVGYRNIDMLNNYWKKEPTPAKQYSTGYTYDANGNILTLDRADESNAKFDQFAYKYQTNASGKLLSNRLYHVNDNPGYTSLMDDDIDDQGTYSATSHNYDYDKIGNLIHDQQEEIDEITWTVTGKVKAILRSSSSSKPDLEFFYDAQGNRLRKIVKPAGSSVNNGGQDVSTEWTTTDYVRDPQGNIMATYEGKYTTGHQYSLKERYLYGSSRLGIDYHEVNMYQALPVTPALQFIHPMEKQFEISNHLGNVLATVSNYAVAIPDGIGGIDHYEPEVVNTSDYYPFGSLLKERTCRWVWKKGTNYSSDPTDVELAFVNMTEDPNNIATEGSRYRFTFNGQERTDEIAGTGNHTTALYWEYDSRLGRRWNVDPAGYPYQSHYSVNNNSPILFSDPLGIYGTKREARQMRREAKAAGYDVGAVYKSGDEYGFVAGKNKVWDHYFKQSYFGTQGINVQDASNLGNDPWFENPLHRIAGTFAAEKQITTFFLGTSDNKIYFDPSSGFSQMMKNSPGVREGLDHYLKTKEKEKTYGFSPNVRQGIGEFLESLPKSIDAHLDVLANSNLPRLAVGGYKTVITPVTGNDMLVRIHLVNDMSMGSLLLHMKWARENPPKTGPLSTVEMKIDLGLFDIGSLRK
jgi:photosystem II stability/assembly factor-like uncharacterized protein